MGSSGEARREREPHALAWYLNRRHNLIRRHTESLELHPDHTARWELSIDLELPTDRDAWWENEAEELLCPFPLVYLRKNEGRMQFEARNESGATVLIPTRAECDAFTTMGLAGAVTLLAGLDELGATSKKQVMEGLEESLARVVCEKPYQAVMVLGKLQRAVGLVERESLPDEESEAERKSREEMEGLGASWREAGLEEVLQMLVEHSLIWVLLKGRPGQRRRIVLSEEKILKRRPFVRWAFGELKVSKHWWVRLLLPGRTHRARKAIEAIAEAETKVATNSGDEEYADSAVPTPPGTMAIEGRPYGRRKRTISLSALGERIGQPMAWMPFEFGFPTIYKMRCASYHFELRCPPGRSPRDLRVAGGAGLAEPEKEQESERKLPQGTRRTLIASIARLDVPPRSPDEKAEAKRLAESQEGGEEGPELGDDTWFRIIVGIGDNAFPVLWFLAAAITALMLWLLADANPQLRETPAQIVAGILLVVPALTAALAIGSDEVPIAQLIGGARILLLVSGLSAVAATAVVAHYHPFGMSRESAWACCAMVATAATIPLGTGWLLSSPVVWRRMKELNSLAAQRRVLALAVGLAVIAIAALLGPCEDAISRGCLAIFLLALPVATSVVANDRAAIPVGGSRNYISISFLGVGFTCLVLGCVEMRSAIEEPVHHYPGFEWAALGGLVLSVGASFALYGVTGLPGIRRGDDEVHVSPSVGEEMLAQERVEEMTILGKREKALLQATIERKDKKQRADKDDPIRRNE